MRNSRTMVSVTSQPARTFSRLKLYAAVLAASHWMVGGQAWASPESGEVVGGEGIIQQTGVETIITQATERMAIDWRSFDVAANERVEFIQPSSSSIALNRVLSNRGSEILGRIDANGQVMLVNANGVVFGKDSIVNVGGMIASGMNIDPASFINGDFTMSSLEGTDGKIINYGIINAATGGSVTLVGKQVQNDGLISAKLGAVNLAAGKEAVLTFDQSGLVGVKVTEAVLQNELGVDAAVINNGEINAEGGRVLLTASVSEDIFSNAVNNAGMNKASSVVVHDDGSFTLGAGADVINTGDISVSVSEGNAGQVVILGENITHSGNVSAITDSGVGGSVELHSSDTTLLTQDSKISAQANSQGDGGEVKILGNKVGLFDRTEVNASGADGGGQVLIGGDKTGANKHVRNAEFIYVGEGTAVKTDALVDGDGGRLITFASDTARVYGNLYSRGGSEGGNGGFIETSGLKGFEILKTPDITAIRGSGGTWLIDPYNIIINNSGSDQLGSSSPFVSGAGATQLDRDTLEAALTNGAVVEVRTGAGGSSVDGNITVNSAIEFNLDSFGTLRLLAHKDIVLNSNIERANGSGAGYLNIELIANRDNTGGASGGNITIADNVTVATNGGYFYAGKSAAEDANGLLNGDYTNKLVNFSSTNATINTSGNNGGGDIVVVAEGTVNLGSLIFKDSNVGTQSQVANILIKAGGDVNVNREIEFDDTGFLPNQSTSFEIQSNANINVNALIHDSDDGEIDAMNIALTSDMDGDDNGIITFGNDIYTAGGNFSASGFDLVFNGKKIDTENANGGNAPTSSRSNGGNVTLLSSSDIELGTIITDASCATTLNNCTGNLLLASRSGLQNISVTQAINTTFSIAGNTTFDIGATGDVTLKNVSNSLAKNLIVTSARDVKLINTKAITFDESIISGSLEATGDGIGQTVGTKVKVEKTSQFDAKGKSVTLANANNDFVGSVATANTSDLTLRDINSLAVAAVSATGNVSLKSGAGSNDKIILDGNVATSAGAVTLDGNVEVASTAIINAGTGTISITGTTNSNDATPKNLTLTGGAITFSGNVGNLQRLGDFKITSTGAVIFADISTKSFDLSSANSFTAQNIDTSGADSALAVGEAGGNVVISAGNVTLTSVDTSGGDSTAVGDFNGGAGGTISLTANNATGSKTITISGDLSAEGGAASGLGTRGAAGAATVTLANTALAGQVNLNSSNFLTSNIAVTGSGAADTLKLTNTSNTWILSAENAGNITGTGNPTSVITFSGFENITGGSGVDMFNLSQNITGSVNGAAGADVFNINVASLDAAVNGGGAADIFNIDVASTKLMLNGDAGEDIFNVNSIGNIIAVLTGGNDGDTLNAANRSNTWLLGTTESLNTTLTFSGIENVSGNSGKDTFSIVDARAVTGTIDADGVGVTDNLNDEVTVASDATINFSSGNFSFFNVLNAEVLSSTNGGKLTVLSNLNDLINWTFATDKSVAKGASSVKFSNFTSYEGGAGNDIFLIQNATPFTGLINGGNGINELDVSSLVAAQTIASASQYQTGSFATLTNFRKILGNNSTSLHLTSGTNAWNITGEHAGSVGSIIFTGVSNIIGASASDSLSTSISDHADWSITGVNAGTLTEHTSKLELIKFGTIGKLIGSGVDDTFSFSSGSGIGSAEGNGGTDTADFSNLAARTITIGTATEFAFSGVERFKADAAKAFVLASSSGATWTIDNSNGEIDGTVGNIEFVGFRMLQGSAGNDTFNLRTDFGGIINATDGNDTFQIRSLYTGELQGGNGADTFVFFDGGSVASSGNSQAGADNSRDQADFSNLVDGSVVTVSGTSLGNIGGIERVVGSATKQFTLAGGTGTNIWRITNNDNGTTYGDGLNDGVVNGIQFTDFKTLLGGAGSDSFTFEGTANSIESIDGGLGINTLRGRDAPNTWLVSATNAGTVSADGSSYVVFSRIQNLTGGALADVFHFNASIRDVIGGEGNDRFIFSSDGNNGSANSINGEGGEDQLFGRRTDNTWSTTGANAGILTVTGGQLYVTNFSGVERWVGGAGADVFTLNHEISNGISAGDGDNRFNVNTEVGDLDGGTGNDQFVFGAAGSARSVNGGGGLENSLTARNALNTWTVTSANTGKIASNSNDYVDSFSNIQTLNGGTGIDIFNINASVDKVFGHAGDDTFSFALNNNGIATLINGGADTDTLRGRTQDSTWTMTAANAGHVGTANTTYVAAFNAIETLSGAANADTLAAIDQANNWAIDGENRGSLRAAATGATAIAFDGMENLLGNQGIDAFTFTGNGELTGLVDGGTTGSKDLNMDIVNLSLKTGGITVQLGRELSNALNIVNVEEIVAAKDVNNNLIGASDTDYQWRITADDQGIVETLLDPLLETSTKFSYFNSLTGGSKNDYFKVVSGRITNRINGGEGNGIDFIDYSARAGHFEIELGGNNGIGATGVFGIEGVRGNSASGLGTSTIKVDGGDNDWQIGSVIGSAADGVNDGSITSGGNKVTFENFTNLDSGSGSDTFTYLANGQWNGVIDGGGGTNTLDASASTLAQQFHVNGVQVGVSNLFNIDTLKGNPATDSRLVGASSINFWSVNTQGVGSLNTSFTFSGITNLRGGSLRDTFNITNTTAFTGIIDGGGSSEDQLNLNGLSSNVSVSIGTDQFADLRVTGVETISANPDRDNTFKSDNTKDNTWEISGSNSGNVTSGSAGATPTSTVTFSGFANLVGGDNADKLNFVNNMSNITGWIDAGAGVDSLDLSGTDRNIVVRLTTSKPASNGEAISVNNIESIVAAANRDNRLIGNNAENTWTIDTANGGRLRDNLSTVTAAFTNFKYLVGGDQSDNFVFESIGTVAGLIDGGGGRDTVDVSKSVNANIRITAATANSGYSNIEKYAGNNTTSTITGDNQVNNWIVSNNSGTINGTIEFEQFANLVGGNNRDIFSLTNATLSGYIDGVGGNDTFSLAGTNVAGEMRGGIGDDEFTIAIVDGFASTADLNGGDGADKLFVSGGAANYKATHQQGVLQYANPANVTYTVDYADVGEIIDSAVADSLTVWGTPDNDIFRLQNDKYWLTPAVTITYQQKQNLILNGSSGDQVIVDGNVVIPKTLTVNNASISSENTGKLNAQSLELVATQGIGSQSNRLQLAVDDLYLKATNGNIYINEQDALNFREFTTSATSVFDVTLGGDLLSAADINYSGQFNANSLRGGITLNNANTLTGNVSLRAAGDVAIKNQASLNLSEIAAQNLSIDVDGVVTGLGSIVVNGLTNISASSNISLMHAENDLNVLSLTKASNVSINDKNNLTLAGASASGAIIVNSNGAVNIGASCVSNCIENGAVRAASLNVDAGTGAITVGTNIVANESVNLTGTAITVSDAVTSNRITLRAGSGLLLLNESGNLNGGSGDLIDLAGGKIEQRAAIASNGDIIISASEDIQMADGALTESVAGNITYSGKNMALAGIKTIDGSVTLTASGTISDNNGTATNIYANRWVADAVAGIGSGRFGSPGQDAIETDVKILSVRNAGKLVNDSKINILNAGSLVIEQLRNNGDISIANRTGDFILDNTNNELFNITDMDARTQGGVINAGTNGGILTLSIPNGVVRAENKHDISNPDIIADIATFDYPVGTRAGFGDINRKIVMHIPSVYKQTARTSAVLWYNRKKPLEIVDSSTPIKNLVSNDQLIQIEGLSEIDPAIFTSVSNYVHDEVAILMPVDQRFDEEEYAQ